MNNDKYGRTVTLVTVNEVDTYTVEGFTVSFPHGTSLIQVYESIEANAPANYVAPVSLSGWKKSAIDFAQDLMIEFSAGKSALSPTQIEEMAVSLAPIKTMLDVGSIPTVITILQGMTPDGVILLQSDVDAFITTLQAYMTTNPEPSA